MPLISAGQTNIGMRRKTNQDSIRLVPEISLFVVADGMGGHKGGDIASNLAVTHFADYIIANADVDPMISSPKSVSNTNRIIYDEGQKSPELKGMGTTIVSLHFYNNNLYITNVGDSRAYMVSKGALYQLSKDHSLVQEKLNLGMYTRKEASHDPMKNVLIRTVGFEEDVDADVFSYRICKNDLFFICSDGLHGKVSDRDMAHIINKIIPDPSTATENDLNILVETLINQANTNGGNDNISVIVAITK